MIFEQAGEASAPTVTVSVSCLPEPRLRDCRDAFVRLGRCHEPRQAGALVRPLCVGALPVLTQMHLVADDLALVYVCRTERHEELQSQLTTSHPMWEFFKYIEFQFKSLILAFETGVGKTTSPESSFSISSAALYHLS